MISITTNMIGMIVKPEKTMNKPDKSLEASSPFTSVTCVVLKNKVT